MKPHPHSHRGCSLSAATLSRASAAAVAAVTAAGTFLLVLGFLATDPKLSFAGAAAVGVAWAGHSWFQRRPEWAPGEASLEQLSLEQLAERAAPIEEEHAVELLALLNQWEAIEEKRGSPEFDPWALQTLRNEIRKKVESNPGLQQLFSELRRVA